MNRTSYYTTRAHIYSLINITWSNAKCKKKNCKFIAELLLLLLLFTIAKKWSLRWLCLATKRKFKVFQIVYFSWEHRKKNVHVFFLSAFPFFNFVFQNIPNLILLFRVTVKINLVTINKQTNSNKKYLKPPLSQAASWMKF